MLGERVLSEEPEGAHRRPPPLPPVRDERAAVDVLDGRGWVQGAGEAGAVGGFVDAQLAERNAGGGPALGLGRVHTDVERRRARLMTFRQLEPRLQSCAWKT